MATVKSIDDLHADERAIVVAALKLKLQSVERAMRAETNAAVRELRSKEVAAINALVLRFS